MIQPEQAAYLVVNPRSAAEMGGPATFAGTNHQAGVIAYVFAHMLAQRRLGWLSPLDDTPLAVSAETGGPGDDVGVEFGIGSGFEVQAKAGLTGEVQLAETIRAIVARAANDLEVVLVVDRRSSGWIYRDFATELERIRGGRTEILPHATALYEELDGSLGRIRVKALDISPPDDPEAQRARDLLLTVVENQTHAEAAWAILLAVAADVAARRLRKDRAAVIAELEGRGLTVRNLGRDERLRADLDHVRQLLERGHSTSALRVLDELDGLVDASAVGLEVRYWLQRHRATALLQLDRNEDALASAEGALNERPDGVEALISASVASLKLGDIAAARDRAQAAIVSAPENAKAWGALAQVNAAEGVPPPTPPDSVVGSTHYITVQAETALVGGDFAAAVEYTAQVVERPDRRPEVLIIRGWALLEVTRGAALAEVQPSQEIEALATQAIAELEDVPLKAKALVIRASVRGAAGRTEEAEIDLRLAAEIDPDDPAVARNLISTRLMAGDEDGALELLYRPLAARDAMLVGVRAELLANRGRREEAERDVHAAVGLLPEADDPDAARLAIAEASLSLGDSETSRFLLEGLSDAGSERPIVGVFEGRLSFLTNDIQAGIDHYERAAESAGPLRNAFIAELGVALARMGEFDRAIETFRRVDFAQVPVEPRRAFVTALMRQGQLAEAQAQIDALGGVAALPEWAIGVAIDIALARDDEDAAITHLSTLVDQAPTNRVRLVLAIQLVEAARFDEAAVQVDSVLASADLSAEDRMQAAQLLAAMGRGTEAVEESFRAFRDAKDDPRMHRALAGIVFASRIDIPRPAAIVADSHVLLRGDQDESRGITVLGAPPFHPSQDEISVDDAQTLGLLGLEEGGTFIEHAGAWHEKRWQIAEVVPAVVSAARDVIANYERRFPNEPFFVTSVRVGDGTEPGDFAPIIRALSERRLLADEMFKLLREQIVPTGMVAKVLGTPISEIQDGLGQDADRLGPTWVEWTDAALQGWSFEQAARATRLVLTESALRTAFELGIQPALISTYQLATPRSFVQQLRRDLRTRRDELQHGHSTMAAGPMGIHLEDIPAGDERLISRVQRADEILRWVNEHVGIEPRPLEWIGQADDPQTALRETIGPASYDAVALAHSLDATLFADDLGLRRVALRGAERPSSTSSPMVIAALAGRGAISADQRDEWLVDLATRGYAAIPPTPGMLVRAATRLPPLSLDALGRVIDTLWRVDVPPAVAALTVAAGCRALATAPIQTFPAARLADLALSRVGDRMPVPLAARLIDRAVSELMRLLPSELEAVRRVCAQYIRVA